ncbi:unnamed protein product [Rhizoctonia solani]|uniref:Uncharacterized protein n=1 Tax=Rhizoctonia solani TaxID=456999 RepID=A0A8H3H275_9AGAM|nr:unnamed protein product [Rhizoctonia solani]CAE6478326.1 unnamed protein product [Rhizoctonia solani]
MFSKSKDVRRPFPARSSSARSLSTSSSRSSLSAWRPDASVRLFVERCHDASPFDDESSLGSEAGLTSGRTSPESRDDLSPISPKTYYTTKVRKADRNIQNSIFAPDMPTSALVVAAREAAQVVAVDIRSNPYSPVDEPELYVGFGTMSKKEVIFRRPQRARANRWASTTRRYVDILS